MRRLENASMKLCLRGGYRLPDWAPSTKWTMAFQLNGPYIVSAQNIARAYLEVVCTLFSTAFLKRIQPPNGT